MNRSFNETHSVYRNNTLSTLASALEEKYPMVALLLGDQFEKAAKGYANLNQSTHWDLTLYGDAFPQYLEGVPTLAEALPFLGDLARLESLIQDLYFLNNNASPHESRRQLSSPWPIVSLWKRCKAHGAGRKDLPPLSETPETALLHRVRCGPRFQIQVTCKTLSSDQT